MNDKLITNPFFMLEFNRSGIRGINLLNNAKYKKLGTSAVQILHQALDGENFETEESVHVAALDAGLLIRESSSKNSMLWERRKWSRAAYLTYSQMNLQYSELYAETAPLADLNQLRREIIQSYDSSSQYQPVKLVTTTSIIQLSVPSDSGINLDALMRRRSQRSFSKKKVSFEDFSHVLYESTVEIRVAEESKKSGDHLYVFNSFYCWVKLYVAVQGVVGIPRGIYQYDPLSHQLRLIRKGVTDKEIYSCIQYQSWIKGGGFCIFISADWERYMWVYRHSRAYINLLIQAGELGQEIFVAANKYSMGGWGTPAVDETKGSKLLGYNPLGEDATYFIKIGYSSGSAQK